MKTRRTVASMVALALPLVMLALPRVASAQEEPAPNVIVEQAPAAQAPGQPTAPPPVAQAEPTDGSLAAPPQATPVYAQPATGQWVYTDAYGWIWVPAGSTSYEVASQPYVYLYTPSYGWTWYVSPWGRGAYYAGPWVHARSYAWGAPHVWVHNAWIGGPRLRVGAPAVGFHYGYGPRVVARPRVGYHATYRAPVFHASGGFHGSRGGSGHHR